MIKWIKNKIGVSFIKDKANEIIEKIKEAAKTKVLGLVKKL